MWDVSLAIILSLTVTLAAVFY
uniref:Uncharacterized protein n=1 Tax=Anguilla anguilla TaxID=7936 RepID=A0A0E9SKH5_ANGAN